MKHNHQHARARDARIEITRHARKRCAQRAVSPEVVPLVQAYGEKSFDGRGGIRYLMTHRATEKLMRVCGATKQLQRLKGIYVVVDAVAPNTVITTGHRH